jgi:hypothetical protein
MTPEQEALRAKALTTVVTGFENKLKRAATGPEVIALYGAFDALHGIVRVVPPVLSLNIAEKYRAAVEGLPGDYRNLVAAGDLTRAPK